jgi:RND family efflux transporter MFP subunit
MRFAYSSLIAVVLVWVASCNRQPPVKAKQDGDPVPVRTAKVGKRSLQRVVESVGTLYPYDEVIISAEIEGRVEKVAYDLGDEVREGAVLCEISDEEQRYLLAQNEAQLRQALERLGLKSEKDRVSDINETPEVRRARADLMEAEQRYRRTRTLVDQNIGAQADLDQAQARYLAAQAALDATLNQTRNLIQEVERFKAVVDLQRKKLRDTTVRAPFSASVKERQVTVGQYVRPNTPLFTLVKTSPIRLRLEVPERMAPWTRIGQAAQITVEAYPDRLFEGRIWRISPTVDETKRTFVVEVLIDNPRGELKPGSYAKARIATNKYDEVKVVPELALNYVLGSNRAYVIKDGQIEAREVKIGDRLAKQIEIIEGLEEGEEIAISQLNRLNTGVRVTVLHEDPAKKSASEGGGSPASD